MSRLVLYSLMSLDGGVDNPRGYFPESGQTSGAPVFDQQLVDRETEMIERQDAVLLGRGMYDQWSQYWPTSDEQPFADFINAVPKHVLTSSPLNGGWAGAEPIAGPLARAVGELTQRYTGDVGVHGSITLARSLLQAGLVDELCLAVGRVIDPVGRRLFAGLEQPRTLRLLEATPTPSGSVWLRYQLTSDRAG